MAKIDSGPTSSLVSGPVRPYEIVSLNLKLRSVQEEFSQVSFRHITGKGLSCRRIFNSPRRFGRLRMFRCLIFKPDLSRLAWYQPLFGQTSLDTRIAREAMEQNWITLRTLNALSLGGGVGFERAASCLKFSPIFRDFWSR